MLLLFAGLLAIVALFGILGVVPAIGQAADFVAGIPDLLDRLAVRLGGDGSGTSFTEWLTSPEVSDAIRGALDDIAALLADSVGLVLAIAGGIVGALFSTSPSPR